MTGAMDKPMIARGAVEQILRTYDGDPEAAHGHEDELLESVVRACAEGDPQAQAMALEAVILLDAADRKRWYA